MKKLLAILLAVCLSVSAITVFAFEDMPNDWSTTALQHAVANGLLNGTDNKLLPKDNLTRAQMATILVRALGAKEEGDISSFTDVKKSAWYYSAMAISYKMGIFRGDGAGKLNPDAAITRQEAFVVLSRAFALTSSTTSGLAKFSDSADVASWAKEGIEALVINGYVGGSNGKLNPNSRITRAEFAQVMYNLIKTYGNTAEDVDVSGEIHGNLIIRGDKVTNVKNLVINGDLIIGDGIPSGFKFDNVTVNGRVVIRAKGSFTFDGTANELVLVPENSQVTISSDSTVSKVNVVSNTSSFEVLEKTGGSTKPSTPTTPTTPTTPDPEEDIWTNFQ